MNGEYTNTHLFLCFFLKKWFLLDIFENKIKKNKILFSF